MNFILSGFQDHFCQLFLYKTDLINFVSHFAAFFKAQITRKSSVSQ